MKKLATVLALTGVVANLGLATVFAQTSEGSQTIGCNAGTVSISLPTTGTGDSVSFEGRSTAFYADATNAPLDVGQSLPIQVTDDRGYDPGVNDCRSSTAPTADHAFTLQIQSPGLTGPSSTVLDLQLGTALVAGDLSETPGTSPSTVGDVATVTGLADTSISTASNIVTFDETFSGDIGVTLTGDQLEVVKPSGVIPAGVYTGTITLSLLNV